MDTGIKLLLGCAKCTCSLGVFLNSKINHVAFIHSAVSAQCMYILSELAIVPCDSFMASYIIIPFSHSLLRLFSTCFVCLLAITNHLQSVYLTSHYTFTTSSV